MNINHMAEYSTVRDICNTTNISGSPMQVFMKKSKTAETMITTVQVVKWLLRPESESEQPLFDTPLANVWANTCKSIFWIGVAIGMGFLIAQLSS